jgi:predicted RNase H-like nuclease (RuvC/YqgF family)
MKVATYKTPTGYTLYTQEIVKGEYPTQINVNVACKNTGTTNNLIGGVALFVGIFDLQDVENANKVNTKRGRLVIDLVNKDENEAKVRQTEIEKLQAEVEKLSKKVANGRKALDKKNKNWEKDLQQAFENATTMWRSTWGNASDQQIKEKLEMQMRHEYQYDYKLWEELVDKLGKLNWKLWEILNPAE